MDTSIRLFVSGRLYFLCCRVLFLKNMFVGDGFGYQVVDYNWRQFHSFLSYVCWFFFLISFSLKMSYTVGQSAPSRVSSFEPIFNRLRPADEAVLASFRVLCGFEFNLWVFSLHISPVRIHCWADVMLIGNSVDHNLLIQYCDSITTWFYINPIKCRFSGRWNWINSSQDQILIGETFDFCCCYCCYCCCELFVRLTAKIRNW